MRISRELRPPRLTHLRSNMRHNHCPAYDIIIVQYIIQLLSNDCSADRNFMRHTSSKAVFDTLFYTPDIIILTSLPYSRSTLFSIIGLSLSNRFNDRKILIKEQRIITRKPKINQGHFPEILKMELPFLLFNGIVIQKQVVRGPSKGRFTGSTSGIPFPTVRLF